MHLTTDSQDFDIGEQFAPGRLLGIGGMGRVLAAHDALTGREVAIKVLNRGATRAERERFRREARLMARLRHRHIMPIFQVIETPTTSAYSMPLVEGESLRDLLRREGRLPYDEVVRILLELAAGLQAAHQAGVVHRDVKPENILLEGSAREVLIMDFGIARSRDPDEPRLTMNGSVLGTPDYMSPEQAAGDPNPGPATDIYAFGIVGFEMITGRLPFEAGTVSGMLVKQVVAVAPRAEWFRPDCPVALADIIARCLAKHPDDRWASVADVAEALQRMPAGTTGWLTRLLARWVPLIRWGTERRSIVARFRRLALLFLVTNLTLFIIDLRDGLLDFAPPLLLVLGLFLSLQYGDLRHAGFTWRDLVGRRAAGRGDGRGTAGNGERGTGDGKDM